jgi:hypothetical protein
VAAVRPPSRDLSGEQRRALEILAGSPHGCPEETLRAHWFTVRLLASIVRAGSAVAKPGDREGGRPDAQHAAANDSPTPGGRRSPMTASAWGAATALHGA